MALTIAVSGAVRLENPVLTARCRSAGARRDRADVAGPTDFAAARRRLLVLRRARSAPGASPGDPVRSGAAKAADLLAAARWTDSVISALARPAPSWSSALRIRLVSACLRCVATVSCSV